MAATIDGVVVCLVLVVAYAVVAGFLFLFDPRGFELPDSGLIFSLVAGCVVTMVYLSLSWWISGRTYGCLVMGLRVVSHRGTPMRLSGALLRAVLCTLFPVGLLWVAVSHQNRSAQDLLLRTSVVYDWQAHADMGRRTSPFTRS